MKESKLSVHFGPVNETDNFIVLRLILADRVCVNEHYFLQEISK